MFGQLFLIAGPFARNEQKKKQQIKLEINVFWTINAEWGCKATAAAATAANARTTTIWHQQHQQNYLQVTGWYFVFIAVRISTGCLFYMWYMHCEWTIEFLGLFIWKLFIATLFFMHAFWWPFSVVCLLVILFLVVFLFALSDISFGK